RGRVLRQPQALPERRLLLRTDLPGDGLSDGLLHRALRARTAAGLDSAVGGDAARSGAEDRPPAPGLHRLGEAGRRADRAARVGPAVHAKRAAPLYAARDPSAPDEEARVNVE